MERRAGRGGIVDCERSMARGRPQLPCDNGLRRMEGQRMFPKGSGLGGKVLGTLSLSAAQARKGACLPYVLRGI